jgi:hypothetical protein
MVVSIDCIMKSFEVELDARDFAAFAACVPRPKPCQIA